MLGMQTIYRKAREYAMEYWGLELDVPININRKLTRVRAHFIVKSEKYPNGAIELAERLIKYENDEFLLSTLKHELCHWALYRLGKPYWDKDKYFKMEIDRIGSHRTGTTSPVGVRYIVKCSECGQQTSETGSKAVVTKKTNPKNGYISKCCEARLIDGGTKVVSRQTERVADADRGQ